MAATAVIAGAAILSAAVTVDQGQKSRKSAGDARDRQNEETVKATGELKQQGLQADAEGKAKKDRARAVSEQRKASGSGREGTILGSEGLGSSAPSTGYQTKTLLGQ